ncbi:hypothetical protein [Clostridium sp. D53t1_180928_C8]|uniref:hypothetical protein n=1 Tax=Clostridium sp. D53t1_180928_C8 TaxID=2787101 RepID=UPI0018AB7015|nr:hypothetical protein [Clostridium sp. D53t1_180928_C8]
MFQKLLDMYVENRINKTYLEKAVKLKWITEKEKNEIIEFKLTVDINDTYIEEEV